MQKLLTEFVGAMGDGPERVLVAKSRNPDLHQKLEAAIIEAPKPDRAKGLSLSKIEAEVDKEAKAIRSRDPSLSKDAARGQAWRNDPLRLSRFAELEREIPATDAAQAKRALDDRVAIVIQALDLDPRVGLKLFASVFPSAYQAYM